MIRKVNGNILDYDNDIIVQQVNCLGVMGGGLARQIMNVYPEVPQQYKKFCKKAIKALSETSGLLGEVLYTDVYDGKIIANIFGQISIRTSQYDNEVYTKYWALGAGLENVRHLALSKNYSVAIPKGIGCGLANGDWEIVEKMIYEIFDSTTLDVVIYNYEG